MCVSKNRSSIKRDAILAPISFSEKGKELGLLWHNRLFLPVFSLSSPSNFRFRETLKWILAS